MFTIGEISKKFSISRSTLLYYDSIGLLCPSGRSKANYRLYSQQDVDRMEKISLYREAGLPLEVIAKILASRKEQTPSLLEQHFFRLNQKIQSLRSQQNMIVKLLGNDNLINNSRILNKNHWISLLRATGLTDEDMLQWHIEFERMSPEAHQDFLETLGIEEDEIVEIRNQSRL